MQSRSPMPSTLPPAAASFYRAVPGARAPMKADPAVLGTVPTRAFQYCEALRAASAHGWYAFSPIDFSLLWDGSDLLWTYQGERDWYPLKTAQFPGFAARFDKAAPRHLRGMSPPFLTYVREVSVVQIWTGFFVETASDWSLLVRAPANYPRHGAYEHYEGIIETDRWFGPLFINIHLLKPDVPIEFSTETPLLQAQPLHRSTYVSESANQCRVVDAMAAFPPEAWQRYEDTLVKPNRDPQRPVAAYATAARKRRRSECPYSGASAP